jgi:hypothetical protein
LPQFFLLLLFFIFFFSLTHELLQCRPTIQRRSHRSPCLTWPPHPPISSKLPRHTSPFDRPRNGQIDEQDAWKLLRRGRVARARLPPWKLRICPTTTITTCSTTAQRRSSDSRCRLQHQLEEISITRPLSSAKHLCLQPHRCRESRPVSSASPSRTEGRPH